MAKLDPNSYRSIRDFVTRQSDVEAGLISSYAGKPQRPTASVADTSAPDYSHLPPDFVPVDDRFPDSYNRRGEHKTFRVHEFDGHRQTSIRQKPVEITGSDYRGDENGRHQLARQGLCIVEDDKKATRAIREKFNNSFADHGDIVELITKLNRLPSMVIPSGITGEQTAPFNGQLEIIVDPAAGEALLVNPFIDFQAALNKKGYFPTFIAQDISLGKEGKLEPDLMLATRKQLTENLGLPLHATDKEIEEAWTVQLEAAYDLWSSQTTEFLKSKGVDIKLPPFDVAMRQQQLFDGISDTMNNPRQQGTGLER